MLPSFSEGPRIFCSFWILKFEALFTSSRPEAFLGKGVLKISIKFKREHPCWSAISIKLQSKEGLSERCSFLFLLLVFLIPDNGGEKKITCFGGGACLQSNNIRTLILGVRGCRLKAYVHLHVQGRGESKITKSKRTYFMDDT